MTSKKSRSRHKENPKLRNWINHHFDPHTTSAFSSPFSTVEVSSFCFDLTLSKTGHTSSPRLDKLRSLKPARFSNLLPHRQADPLFFDLLSNNNNRIDLCHYPHRNLTYRFLVWRSSFGEGGANIIKDLYICRVRFPSMFHRDCLWACKTCNYNRNAGTVL